LTTGTAKATAAAEIAIAATASGGGVVLKRNVVERYDTRGCHEQTATQPGAATGTGTASPTGGDRIFDGQIVDGDGAAKNEEPALIAEAVHLGAVAVDRQRVAAGEIDGVEIGGSCRALAPARPEPKVIV
jgi:hypothetical protein